MPPDQPKNGHDPRPQDWEARYTVAAEVFAPWLDRIHPLAGKTVLDYGSGGGSVSCAVAERAGRVVGYDINAHAVEHARDQARERGLDNLEVETIATDEIFARVRSHAGEIDVVLLYAVLEHLTTSERLEVLRVAREVVRDDGVIVVVETPNRLVDTDYHTSMLPFFNQLPSELALEYANRSPRTDFREQILAARESDADGGELALTRWGTGVSFHEFETVFGDLSRHVVAGGYDPALLGERTIHNDELALARYLERVRPDLPPPFSRFWLDLVIRASPVEPGEVRMIRPWSAETGSSETARWTAADTVTIDPEQRLTVRPPAPTDRAVCVVAVPTAGTEVTLRSGETGISARLAGEPHHPLVADLQLPGPVSEFTLEVSDSAHVQFVGYEQPGG